MSVVFVSARNATASLFAPGVPMLVMLSCAITALVLLALGIGTGWVLAAWLGNTATGTIISWLAGTFGTILLIGMLFPLLTPIIISFFDEAIADRIEKHAFPKLTIGHGQPLLRELAADLRFTLKAIALNLLVLPLLLVPPVYMAAYYALNSYLLGTQFFMMAGGRHIGKAEARTLAQKHRATITIAGLIVVACSHVPVLNLIAPAWGVALMVHLFQALYPQPQVLPAA